jgi:hypothetical protein
MNFLPEKKYGVPSHNIVKKNVLCEKGDEITRFDGRYFTCMIDPQTNCPILCREMYFMYEPHMVIGLAEKV